MSRAVREMFDAIAGRYDLANALITGGLDRLWRRRARALLAPRPGERILDLCCGTGDVALDLARVLGPAGRAVGVDFCAPMLARAAEKRARRGVARHALPLLRGDALALPFRDASFDGATISFGLRNVDDPVRALREMARVVRPGGRVVVLETGRPGRALTGRLQALYSRHAVPLIGRLVTGLSAPYEYLPRTAAAFPSGEALVELMRDAGLDRPRAQALLFGAAFLYRAEVSFPKPKAQSPTPRREPCFS